MTEPQLVMDTIWDGILYYLSEGPVIPSDTILEFGKLNKIIDSFPIFWQGNHNDSILIIIL